MLRVFPASLIPSDSLLSGWTGGLPYALNAQVTQKINGDWCMKLTYPCAAPGAELLTMCALIMDYQGQLFRIRRIKTVDDGNKQYLEIEAPHVAFDLQNYCIENIETDANDETLDGITATEALTQILSNTPFSVGTVDVNNAYLDYLDILQKNAMTALKDQLVKKWGGELFFDNWTISLRNQCGTDRKYPVRQRKNIAALKYTEDLTGTITRLHIIGYNGADIKDVNGGLDYLDSQYITSYPFPLEGYATFSDEDMPGDLKALGAKYLQTAEVPQISFDISLIRLKDSPLYHFYAPLETCELGDTALLHHDALHTDFTLRCQERVYDAATGVNASVKLGNAQEVLSATLSAAKDAAAAMQQITDEKGRLRANKLSGVIDAIKTCLYASAEYQTAKVKSNQGILLENTSAGAASYGAMYLGPGLFALANTKDANGAWNWRSFGNGSGFSADEITAGTLAAARINVNELDLNGNTALKTALETLSGLISLSITQTTHQADIATLAAAAAAAQSDADALKTRAAALELTSGGLTVEVSELADTTGENRQAVDELRTYFRVTADGAEVGKAGSAFSSKWNDTQLAFLENGLPVAWISNNTMYNTNAHVKNKLQIGNYLMIKTSNGGFGLAWNGE